MGFMTATTLESATGALLALRRAEPDAPPQGVVIISHGLAEHSGRYGAFAERLASQGFMIYAHDHRGHGGTKAKGAPIGRFAQRNGPQLVIADVMAVRNLAAAENPGLPIILFGHSMGGMIAAATAEAYPDAFDGLAIWNADLNPGLAGKMGRLLLKIERGLKGSDVPSAFGSKFTFQQWAKSVPDHITDFDWLSRDQKEVAAYIADPFCGWDPSVSMWLDVIQMADEAGSVAALGRLSRTMPVNIVGGGHDPATSNGAAMEWLARRMTSMGFLNIHLTLYPEMRHETLNELGRDDAIKAFAAWADSVVSRESGMP
jgi:alpha-beta hydrolase superfamily lysophospholipase